MNHKDLEKLLKRALQKFLERDHHLIEVRSSERSICHRIAYYLENTLASKTFHVDCEYNRNSNVPKRLRGISTGKNGNVLPDLVIHKRGASKNILVIEAKYANSSQSFDRTKIASYIEELNYRHGVILTIPNDIKEDFAIEWWFKNHEGRATVRPVVNSKKVDFAIKAIKNLTSTTKRLGLKPEVKATRKSVRAVLKKVKDA